MEDECKVPLYALDAEDRNQTKRRSTLAMVLLGVTLCLAVAAVAVLSLNQHTKGPGGDEDHFDLHHTLRQISNVRAAIHLQGKYNQKRKSSVEWNIQMDQSHSQGDLVFQNNEIVISKKGLYFVYSQASFHVSCSSSDTDDTSLVHLSHSVMRWSSSFSDNNDYKPILHSVRTACQRMASSDLTEGENWYSAVYMGAVFNLKEGDRLKTMTVEKMLPYLADESGETFFGVFEL